MASGPTGHGDDTDIKVFDTLFTTNHKFCGYSAHVINVLLHTSCLGMQDAALKYRYSCEVMWIAGLSCTLADDTFGQLAI